MRCSALRSAERRLYSLNCRVAENYRTQSSYNNALATKIFFFEFVNLYAPTFYIAFIKGKCVQQLNYFILYFDHISM